MYPAKTLPSLMRVGGWLMLDEAAGGDSPSSFFPLYLLLREAGEVQRRAMYLDGSRFVSSARSVKRRFEAPSRRPSGFDVLAAGSKQDGKRFGAHQRHKRTYLRDKRLKHAVNGRKRKSVSS